MNCVSMVWSMTSTFPWPGDKTELDPAGTRAVGSRKKYNVKMQKSNQSTSRTGMATAEKIVPSTEAMAMKAQIAKPAMNERRINLKAALLALPECFMCP